MTAAQARAAFERAEAFAPEPPRPLTRALPPADPFPADALGDVLGAAAHAIHDRVRAPLAIGGQAVLGAACLAVQGHADVELPTGQARPVSANLLTLAPTGGRKTSADHEALWPVRRREAALAEAHKADLPRYENDLAAWKKQREQILNDRKKYGGREAKRQALDELGPPPKPLLTPLLTCPEPTVEGLCRLLAAGHPSVGVFSAEGGQFIGGHGMNPDNRLKTAAALSALWDGAPIRRVRAGDGVVLLPGRRVALHLMAQPDVAAGLLGDRLLADQGLLSRLLVSAPEPAAGTRFWREPAPAGDAALKRYGARLLDILEAPLPLAEGTANELAPPPWPLAPRARAMWIGFADHVEREMGPGGGLEPVRGLANKLAEHAARLAAVLALVDDLEAGEVGARHLAAGIELAQHYAAEALRLFAAAAVSQELRLAQDLLAWLLGSWPEPLVALPEIYQRGPRAIRDKRTAERLVGILEDHGWLIPVAGGAEVAGVPRREAWRVDRGTGG